MGYVVAHFRKVKTSTGMGNVANHNSRANVMDDTGGWKDRENLPPWLVHPERITHNEGQLGRRGDSIQRMWHRVVQDAELKRKPQKNAAVAIEAVFSATPGAITQASEWKAYFKDCREWLDKRFGHENILQWNTHFDEKTPHMHVLLAPIVRDPELGNKYSSADFLGGREGLRAIQTELYEQVGRKYGLERGVEGQYARHTNQAEWNAELARKEKEVKEVAAKLKEILGEDPLKVKAQLARFNNQTPADLRMLAKGIEAKGCRTLGEFRKVMEDEKQQQQQKVVKFKR